MDAWDDLTASGMMSIFSHVWQPVNSGAWGLLETLDDYGESPQDGNYKWYGWQDWRDSIPTDAPVSATDAFAITTDTSSFNSKLGPNVQQRTHLVQRSGQPLEVVTSSITTDTTILINDSEVAADEQIYVWGVAFCTSSIDLVTAKLEANDSSQDYMLFGASNEAAFIWQSNVPFVVEKGEGFQLSNAVPAGYGKQLSSTVGTITLFYTKVNVGS